MELIALNTHFDMQENFVKDEKLWRKKFCFDVLAGMITPVSSRSELKQRFKS